MVYNRAFSISFELTAAQLVGDTLNDRADGRKAEFMPVAIIKLTQSFDFSSGRHVRMN